MKYMERKIILDAMQREKPKVPVGQLFPWPLLECSQELRSRLLEEKV
jgi:hypothetical protein